MNQQIDWSGLKTAAIALQSVRKAALQAAGTLISPKERDRFVERVNKRAYRERWLDPPQEQSPNTVQTGSQLLSQMAQAGHNPAILSLIEKREYLASVVRTPVGDVDEKSKLAQKVKRKSYRQKDGTETNEEEIELPGKLRAIELDAKLAGELDPRPEQNGLVAITLVRMELPRSETAQVINV